MSLNVLPRPSACDLVDRRDTQSVASCKLNSSFSLRCESFTDLDHVFLDQLGAVLPRAVDVAVSLDHVSPIVSVSAEKQIVRVDIEPNIVAMPNNKPIRDRTVEDLVRDSMSPADLTSSAYSTVPRFESTAWPKPEYAGSWRISRKIELEGLFKGALDIGRSSGHNGFYTTGGNG